MNQKQLLTWLLHAVLDVGVLVDSPMNQRLLLGSQSDHTNQDDFVCFGSNLCKKKFEALDNVKKYLETVPRKTL